MKRDPTLHIKLSDLVKVISTLGIRGNPSVTANAILTEAQAYQIRDRFIIQAKYKAKKKLDRVISADNAVVGKFNRVLTAMRLKNNHKGVLRIDKNHKNYIMLIEVAQLADKFAEDFDIIPREDGYKEFCTMGIEMMGRKYSINKFKYYTQAIYDKFQAMVDVLQDSDPEGTIEFYKIWNDRMIKYAALDYVIPKSEYHKYIYFVDGRKSADDYEAEYTDWIEAQFKALAFLNATPDLVQFSNEGAVTRYERYLKNDNVSDRTEMDNITEQFKKK